MVVSPVSPRPSAASAARSRRTLSDVTGNRLAKGFAVLEPFVDLTKNDVSLCVSDSLADLTIFLCAA